MFEFYLGNPGLSAAELESMRNAVASCLEEMGLEKVTRTHPDEEIKKATDSSEDYYNRFFVQRMNLWRINGFIKGFFADPLLGKILLCRLEGIDGIRIWHDQTLLKRPWANPTSWHLDSAGWSFDSRHAISVWIALNDATIGNGCMWYLPGSHKDGDPTRVVTIGNNMEDIFSGYPQWKGIKAVPAPMKAGDCGFHSGLTAHGANANMTPDWRKAMTCAYMPDGATFVEHRNILPLKYFESLTLGDELNNDHINPLVYRA